MSRAGLTWADTCLGGELPPCCRETIDRAALSDPDAVLLWGTRLGCGEHVAELHKRDGLMVWTPPRPPRRERPTKPTPRLMGVRRR